MSAIIRLSSALCAACSLMIFSLTPSAFESSAVDWSMRFCSCNIFWSVLSRNGAENATESGAPWFRRISSFRGRRFSSRIGSGSFGFGLEASQRKSAEGVGMRHSAYFSTKVMLSAISATRLAILDAMIE